MVGRGFLYSQSRSGSGLVTNGDFAGGDVNWVKGTGWSIAGNKASCDGTQVATSFLQGIVATPDITKNYHLEVVVSGASAGGVQCNAP